MTDTPNSDAEPSYEVGYGRPPEHGKIKPGEVRNKKGRKKGARGHKTLVREMLEMPVAIQDGRGRRSHISTSEASLRKLREKALRGNDRALDKLLQYAADLEAEDLAGGSTRQLMAEDEQILVNARQRAAENDCTLQRGTAGEGGHDSGS